MAKSLYENGTIKVGGSDEWYTPKCAVEVIEKYIPANSRILCPFDTEESQFVKVLSQNHNVIFSHISNGENFFKMGKPDVDYVISNPPYSTKDEVFRQLYNWDIPFALLVNANNTFDSFMRFKLAKENGVQILFLYPRVKYICGNGGGGEDLSTICILLLWL